MKWTFAAARLLRDWGQYKRRVGPKKIAVAAGIAAIAVVDIAQR
jgi:hypothetical protein